ncbi:DUF433 domain-containing protein [Longimicrobium sp.]|uniref:DUF433 domain-containing protein n=1 Tax=Longimicrobium sp. TaxID=2029185 RepID=UPI002EDB7E87
MESIVFGECLGRVDWADYDEGRHRTELIDGLLAAEAELDTGLGRLHEDVFGELLQQYGGRADIADTAMIVSNPDVMFGKPVIAGTRITVEHILEELRAGSTIEELIEGHPRLTRAGIAAALEFDRAGGYPPQP